MAGLEMEKFSAGVTPSPSFRNRMPDRCLAIVLDSETRSRQDRLRSLRSSSSPTDNSLDYWATSRSRMTTRAAGILEANTANMFSAPAFQCFHGAAQIVVDNPVGVDTLKRADPGHFHDVRETIKLCPDRLKPESWACPGFCIQDEQ
jgi:hypothetical protein